jgi:MinD superfamily P-loop ATPase
MSAQKDFHLGNNPLKIVIVAINVAGDKGSTGKTVATNLALSVESDVLLLDCTDKASAVFIMTEPTVSGKHDTERIAELAVPLNINAVKPRLKIRILQEISAADNTS